MQGVDILSQAHLDHGGPRNVPAGSLSLRLNEQSGPPESSYEALGRSGAHAIASYSTEPESAASSHHGGDFSSDTTPSDVSGDSHESDFTITGSKAPPSAGSQEQTTLDRATSAEAESADVTVATVSSPAKSAHSGENAFEQHVHAQTGRIHGHLPSDAAAKHLAHGQASEGAENTEREGFSKSLDKDNHKTIRSIVKPAATVASGAKKALAPPQQPSPVSSQTPSINAATAALEEVLVGTRVSEGHESFVTAYNMLTGIRVAVSRCNAKLNRELAPSDFTDVKELSFDLTGDGSTPSTKYMFQFKDYAPWVFRHLRDRFKLDPADYLMSLTAKYIVSELGSPGKSGSFFYYSRDYRFIIKTVRHSEHKRLRQILPEYYAHVKQYPNTLVSQFYGLHRVKLPFGRKIHFVVMNNVFPAVYEMHARYDLKGSTLGRSQVSDPEKPHLVYKDLDWLRNHERIVLGQEKRQQLLKQLKLDVQMLEKCNVMDYSLLIGIHDMSKGNAALDALINLKEFGPGNDASKNSHDHNYGNVSKRENAEFAKLQTLLSNTSPTALKDFDFSDDFRKDFLFYHDRGGFQSTDDSNQPRDVIYYMGVIDFLTAYTLKKRAETFCKGLVHKRSELSALPAVEYGERFYRFMCMSVGSAIKVGLGKHDKSQPSTSDENHEDSDVLTATENTALLGRASATTAAPGPTRQVRPASSAASLRSRANSGTAITTQTSNGRTAAVSPQLPTVSNRASTTWFQS